MTVAIYIRWSTEDQAQGHTLAIQRESCHYYCLSQGWPVAGELTFIDDGYSGASLKRPALTRLRQAVQEGRVRTVVVYKLDRLSRNVRDMLNLVLGEWDGRCAVRSTQEPVDTTTDAGRLFFTMLGSFADFERATIKTRTWSGRLKNAEQGRNPGHPYPYGYRRGDDGGYALAPDEAAVVQEIFERYGRGHSCHAIALELNRRAIPTRHGRGWADATVARLLRNPIYTGRLVYNGTVAVEGAAPALVAPEVWAGVQQIRRSRPRVGRAGSPRTQGSPFLLTGLARCTCGHALAGHYGSRQGRPYYYCVAALKKGATVCQAGMIGAPLLEEAVVRHVREAWPYQAGLKQQVLARLEVDLAQLRARSRHLHRRLGALAQALARFRQDYRRGKLPVESFTELTEETQREQETVAAALATAEAEQQRLVGARPDPVRAAELYARLDAWDTLAPAERKHLLGLLVAGMQVFRPRKQGDIQLQVEWRLPDPHKDGGTRRIY